MDGSVDEGVRDPTWERTVGLIGHPGAGATSLWRVLEQAAYHVSNHSYKTSGGAHIQLCPLCPDEHEICRFHSDSMACIRAGCQNPHHRRLG
jgi:hypothetical protein